MSSLSGSKRKLAPIQIRHFRLYQRCDNVDFTRSLIIMRVQTMFHKTNTWFRPKCLCNNNISSNPGQLQCALVMFIIASWKFSSVRCTDYHCTCYISHQPAQSWSREMNAACYRSRSRFNRQTAPLRSSAPENSGCV